MDCSGGDGRVRLFDILITPTTTPKGRALLESLSEAAPENTRTYTHGKPRNGSTLVLYGLGGEDRYRIGLEHVASGGTLVCFDVGYWNRAGTDRTFRVSINGLHPQDYVMRGPCPDDSRWSQSHQAITKRGDPDGPIVLVGNGPKSVAIGAGGWAAAKAVEIRQKFPGRKLVYRPKPKRPFDAGVNYDAVDTGPIDSLLSRASVVVCRHSNVAVDACRLGVPVVCEDGAAAAIYPSRLEDWERQPKRVVRREFLHRLAWWQWSPSEAKQFWSWLQGVLGAS